MGDFTDSNQVDPSTGFTGIFIAVAVIIGLSIAVSISVSIYRATKVARSGENPLTLDNDLKVRALESATLAPAKSLEQRLAEVDSLHARGVISDAEHAAARASIISG